MQKVKEIVRYAYNHSQSFYERMNAASLTPQQINSFDEFNKIPVLKKDELPGLQEKLRPFGGLLTSSVRDLARVFMSPGPIYDPQSDDGDYWRFAEALQSAGFSADDIVQNTFSYHLSPAGFMFDSALRTIGATVIPAGTGNRELQVSFMKDLAVTGYVGTPSFFQLLLETIDAKGYRFGEEILLSKAFFTAEPTSQLLRHRCEKEGIAVFEGYGTADCGCIAYEDKSGEGLKVTDTAIIQICDPHTGQPVVDEIGEIVVTTFDPVYPLIRFGTGDLSKWVQGYEGSRMSGILGRVSDGIKVKGMFVREKQLKEVLQAHGVTNFRAVVTSEGNQDLLNLYVEANKELPLHFIEGIQDVIRVRPNVFVVDSLVKKDERCLVDERK